MRSIGHYLIKAALFAVCFGASLGARAGAAEPTPSPSDAPTATPAPERLSIHGQATDVQQYHGAYTAAYSGAQSLYAGRETAKTDDATLFLGVRIGKSVELYVDPEIDQGFGLGQPATNGLPAVGSIGAAGFFSAEAYKVGRDSSYGRIQRAFVRDVFELGGGEAATVDPDINQLGGSIDPKSLTLTAGKFSVVDVFDNNAYAHDPKNDFLNWSIVDMGAFDYAADAWGYTYGVSAELANARSTVRAGLFQLSATPNEIAIEHTPFRQFSPIVEYERRTSFLGGHPGAIKALVYADDGYMASYADAVALGATTGQMPNPALVRKRNVKSGGGINIAQEIAPDVGFFARLSAMNGTYEAFDFTDVDRSLSTGISIDGHLYHRPGDAFGLAGAFNGISNPAQQFFAAGGNGILVGDGALTYGGERILETYYKASFTKHFGLTFDYQRIGNPAYNVVRGPVSVYGARYHLDF
jgi:high affinity Mn2+ porin